MAIEKEIIIDVESAKANKSLAKLTDAIKDVNKEAEKTNKETAKGLDNLDKSSKKTSKGIGGLSKGFKALGTAMKATGIGLIVAVVAKLTQAFSQNQKVVDAVSSVFNGINIVFTEVTNAIVSAYEAASEATGGFDALGKVLGGILTLALTPLKLALFGLKLGVQEVQLAWEKSFFGDKDQETIKQLNLDILETKKNLVEVGQEALKAGEDIYNNFSEAIDEVGSLTNETIEQVSKVNVKAAMEQGKALTEARKAAQIAQVELQGLIEKYDRQAEVQRQIRDDERLSIDERIKANDELGRILEEQLQAQLKLANQRVAAAQLEIKATGDNTENQVALKEALNEVAAVQAQITGFASEQRVNEAALQKERLENINEIALIGKTEQERQAIEAQQELERQRLLIEKTITNEQEKNAALLAAKQEYNNVINEIQAEQDAKQLEEAKKIADAEMALEQQKMAAKRQAVDDAINLAGAETKVGRALLIVKQGLALKEMIMEAKKTLTFSKLAVAKSTVATAEGTAQTAKIGFPQNIPMLIGYAAQAVGIISAIKAATNSANSVASSFGGGGGGGSTPAAQSQPPQFNIVGQDSNNQLAQTIAQQENQPVQAYVVANDVTTAQSLNNNIVEGATL